MNMPRENPVLPALRDKAEQHRLAPSRHCRMSQKSDPLSSFNPSKSMGHGSEEKRQSTFSTTAPGGVTMMESQSSIADLNAVLERTPFLKPYGFLVQSCAAGECVLRVLKRGQRCAYGTAECTGVASGLLAHHFLTYVKVTT